MAHVFETAPTGRAKCRGCGRAIAQGDVRFGEKLPNPYADGEMTLWFHPPCAALKRPEPFLEAVAEGVPVGLEAEKLAAKARGGLAHRRLPRVDGAERSPSGRARCRCCREPIPKGEWRISLVFYQDGRFQPSGHIHATCARAYFEAIEDVADRVRQFSEVTETDLEEIRAAISRPSS
jgi:hypothetical protein